MSTHTKPVEGVKGVPGAARTYLLSEPIPFGRIFDVGMRDYSEFACSRSTLSWLEAGAMKSIDGKEVKDLKVMDEIPPGNNVIVKFWTQDRHESR